MIEMRMRWPYYRDDAYFCVMGGGLSICLCEVTVAFLKAATKVVWHISIVCTCAPTEITLAFL